MNKIFIVLALILATSYATLSSFSVTADFGSTTAGFPVWGAAASDAIKLVAEIGDFNGDGKNDYVIASSNTRSTIYVILGQTGGRTAFLNLATSADTQFLSFQLAAAEIASGLAGGDINGDGTGDIAIGVTGGQKVHVIYGSGTKTWDNTATWSAPAIPITDPRRGFEITTGADYGLGAEGAIAFGDFLGDSKDDLILGMAGHGTNKGAVCVVVGRQNLNLATGAGSATDRGTQPVICDSITTLDDTNFFQGRLITGAANDKIGKVVAAGTDMTADGFEDILVGLDGVSKAYLIYGITKVTTTPPTLTYGADIDLGTATNRLEITLPGAIRSTNYIGDFNGDGKDDLALGYAAGALASKAYVLFGQANKYTALTAALDLTSATSFTSTYGITYSNAESGDYFGWVVDGADVNNDQISDLLVSAPLADGSRAAASAVGKVYVIYGSKSNTAAVNLNTGSLNGIVISGVAASGFGTTLAAIDGGINNSDSIDDFVVSAPLATRTGGLTGSGAVYEFRGQAITPSGSGFRLHFSVLAVASILVALMF